MLDGGAKKLYVLRVRGVYIGNGYWCVVNPTLKDEKSPMWVPLDLFYLQGTMFGDQDGHPFRLGDFIGCMKYNRKVAAP